MALHICDGEGSPIGEITPAKLSQHYTDTLNSHTWISFGLTDQDWVKVGDATYSTSVETKTSDYSILALDSNKLLLADTSLSDIEFTMPTNSNGLVFNIKKVSSDNIVTIVGGTFDGGETELQINNNGTCLTLVGDGTNWSIQ